MHLLDEECQLPKTTDKSFIDKLRKNHDGHPNFVKIKVNEPIFAISHYAGKVTYRAEGLLDKNRNLLRSDLEHLCVKSSFDFLANVASFGLMEDLDRKQKVATIHGSSQSKVKTVCGKFEVSFSWLALREFYRNPSLFLWMY